MKQTKFAALAALLTALLLSACGKQKQTPQNVAAQNDAAAAQDAALRNVRLVLDWTPNTNHTGIYAALELGYFAEAGFNLSILQPPEDGALIITAAGGAEYCVDFQETMGPAIARKEAPLPVTAVAAVINHNTSGIMSLASSGIKSPRHLAGKRFASWETPLVTEIIRNVVETDGGNFSAVKMIPNYATDAISALQTDIDAIWIYYAWDGVKAELEGIPINYIDFGALNPVFDFYTPVIAANSNYLNTKPEEARQFMAALSKGYEYAIKNPKEAAAILLKHAPELDAKLVHQSQIYLTPRYTADAPRWGEIDTKRWRAFYGWMYEKGLLEQDVRDKGFTNEFLP
ncbi:MAG: ABC transporter substrate-binding protein [Spirochaetaceae bacterium]|jgi:ABC-type nitrate/sulfonate/bicarbonate transport system substrate-binding protein|nr:ABC transporter substrate-binding protein [Spirochaetaceae bacterium]